MTARTSTTDLRRQSDIALGSIDKRLALVEQAADSNAKVADARWGTVEAAIRAVDAKLDTVTAAMTEPAASPAGRALAADIVELTSDVRTHETFLAEVRGALRLARFALGTSFISVVGNIVLAIAMTGQRP